MRLYICLQILTVPEENQDAHTFLCLTDIQLRLHHPVGPAGALRPPARETIQHSHTQRPRKCLNSIVWLFAASTMGAAELTHQCGQQSQCDVFLSGGPLGIGKIENRFLWPCVSCYCASFWQTLFRNHLCDTRLWRDRTKMQWNKTNMTTAEK